MSSHAHKISPQRFPLHDQIHEVQPPGVTINAKQCKCVNALIDSPDSFVYNTSKQGYVRDQLNSSRKCDELANVRKRACALRRPAEDELNHLK